MKVSPFWCATTCSDDGFQEARDTSDPYPSAQSLFEQGRAAGEDDTFNDVFKKDFIEVTAMKARRKMQAMRIDPYPNTIIRWGLHKKEARETAKPVLEEAMMYTAVVGMEVMEGLAMTSDAVDRVVLEASERKAEVDGVIVRLRHQLGQRDDRITIIDEWKDDMTVHMRDIGEAQGLIRGRLLEAELRLTQFQALAAAQRHELDLVGGVVLRQSAVIDVQCRLLLEMEGEFNRKLERLERMMDPVGRTLGNPILIEDDPVEDVVTLVGHEE